MTTTAQPCAQSQVPGTPDVRRDEWTMLDELHGDTDSVRIMLDMIDRLTTDIVEDVDKIALSDKFSILAEACRRRLKDLDRTVDVLQDLERERRFRAKAVNGAEVRS